MDISYNSSSIRAVKARLGHRIGKTWYVVLGLLSFVLLVSGAGLLYVGMPFGWLFIGFTAFPFMLMQWDKYELEKPKLDPGSIDGLLSADLLGKLGKDPTPRQVADAVATTQGGKFLAIRFGITGVTLQNITTDQPAETHTIW